ncbi:hypothetical protein P8452_34465 [Trifolium repens]|nr:hypothetical protein P8452_34465 [Trifolium repens]
MQRGLEFQIQNHFGLGFRVSFSERRSSSHIVLSVSSIRSLPLSPLPATHHLLSLEKFPTTFFGINTTMKTGIC